MKKHRDKSLDLNGPVPEQVIRNIGIPIGMPMLMEIDGCLHLYHHNDDLFLGNHLSKKLQAELNWFEKLVPHAPSVGSFYEDVLRTLIEELMPSRLKVGTGFVFDALKRKTSKQLDILVYDDTYAAPLYKNGNFVVINPEITISIAEIKKCLLLSDVRKLISSSANANYGYSRGSIYGVQFINVFAYSSRTKTDRVEAVVVEEIKKHLFQYESKNMAGHHVLLGAESIVLPRFYFFDRSSVIETFVRKHDKGNTVEVIVSTSDVHSDNGLNEFFHRMMEPYLEDDLLVSHNYRTIPFRNVQTEVNVGRLFLIRRFSVLDLVRRYPNEAEYLKKKRIRGQRVYSVIIPSVIDLSMISSVRELEALPMVSWEIYEEDKIS